MRLHRPRPAGARRRVSVVIPCYNYGHYLPEAVHSVLTQPGVDLEVVIVDDCSTDDSAAVATRLAAAHPAVRLVRNPVNLRHIATYNTGLAQTSGDYVVLLSADDMLAPGSLARAVALMEHRPEVVLVYGGVTTFETAPPPAPTYPRTWSTWRGGDWVARSCRSASNLIVNPEAVLRRSALERLGGYDPGFPHAADMLLWLRAATLGDVGRVNGTQAYYREHGTNMHRTDYSGTLRDLQEKARVLEAFLGPDGEGGCLPHAPALRGAARRTLAREAVRYAVAEHDRPDGGDPAAAAALADFASRTWPGIEDTRLWAAHRARARGPAPAWRVRAARTTFGLRWRLRWQRRQRWGT